MNRKPYKINNVLAWYSRQPWLRALVQLQSGGGFVDVLLSQRASGINQKRLEELIKDVSDQLASLKESALNKEFLKSEEFFELFRRCAEIAAHTANSQKRKLVADFLAGTVKNSVSNDITPQILEDLNTLQPLHLEIIANLPSQAGKSVNRERPLETLPQINPCVWQKGIADLERLGFVRFKNAGIAIFGGGGGHWETTEYLVEFKNAFNA